MPDLRTTVTELVTGLGTLGYPSIDAAIAARPPEMVSCAPETWELLERARTGSAHAAAFEQAWSNGCAFFAAREGLRGRRPVLVEWKGAQRAPGDEVAPIDLRIDHVYLISCKYRSAITINAAPGHLFRRLLQGPHGVREPDWFEETALEAYQALYETVRSALGLPELPRDVRTLGPGHRRTLADALREAWPSEAVERYRCLVAVVAERSVEHWRRALATSARSEAMLWRILRMGSAPYYLLGASSSGPLRARVATPWDWRAQYRLRRFDCEVQQGGQARVGWWAIVEDRNSGAQHRVQGHVEVRWSHGRFGGPPEAKVYLDTPFAAVPGYFPLR